MALSSGSFSAPIAPDLGKELESQVGTIAAGAGVPMVFNNLQPQQGATIYNVSGNVIRGTVLLTAGIIALGAAATRAFTIPAGGTYSFDLADEGITDSATGAIGAIDQITIVPVTVPVAAGVVEASTMVVAAAATAGYVVVNWASA